MIGPKGKDSLLKTSIMQCHLERLTEYYDMETSEYKKRSKIRFTLKIINSAKSVDKTNVIESGGIEQKKNEKDLNVKRCKKKAEENHESMTKKMEKN